MSAPHPVPYHRQTVDSPNPLARFAHRARTGTALTVAAADAPRDGRVLDYGCGPGTFLRSLGDRRPDLELLGYDPYFPEGPAAGVTLLDDMAVVDDRSIGLLTAFEACEHMTDDELDDFLDQAERTLSADGLLLVSVPVIGGPVLLAKELNRALLHRRRSDYTLPELAAAAFLGRPAPRTDDVRTSHKGFDFRALRARIQRRFALREQWCSPFPIAPWPVNSQHFSCWRPRA